MAWAAPLTDGVAVGAGLSYRYRGAFEPWTGAGSRYDPGDELLLTAGVDYRLGAGSVAAVDLLAAWYGTDAWGDLNYDAGGALGASARWTSTVGRGEAHVSGHVLRRVGRDVPPEAEARVGLDVVAPAEGSVHARALVHVDRRLSMGLSAGVRAYAASEAFSGKVLVDLSLENGISVSDGLSLVGHFTETFGGLRGTGAALGLTWSL